jgi:hypothetical protein
VATKRDTVEKCIVPYRREIQSNFACRPTKDKNFKISYIDKVSEA